MYIYVVTRIKPLDVKPDGPGNYRLLHTSRSVGSFPVFGSGLVGIDTISLLTLPASVPSHAHTRRHKVILHQANGRCSAAIMEASKMPHKFSFSSPLFILFPIKSSICVIRTFVY